MLSQIVKTRIIEAFIQHAPETLPGEFYYGIFRDRLQKNKGEETHASTDKGAACFKVPHYEEAVSDATEAGSR